MKKKALNACLFINSDNTTVSYVQYINVKGALIMSLVTTIIKAL